MFHLSHLGGQENNGVLGLAQKDPVEQSADRTGNKGVHRANLFWAEPVRYLSAVVQKKSQAPPRANFCVTVIMM